MQGGGAWDAPDGMAHMPMVSLARCNDGYSRE